MDGPSAKQVPILDSLVDTPAQASKVSSPPCARDPSQAGAAGIGLYKWDRIRNSHHPSKYCSP